MAETAATQSMISPKLVFKIPLDPPPSSSLGDPPSNGEIEASIMKIVEGFMEGEVEIRLFRDDKN